MSEIQFTLVDAPTTTTAPDYGPFVGVFPVAEGKALTAVFPDTEDGHKQIAKLIKQARAAAGAANVSARQKQEPEKDGKNAVVRLSIWSIPKVNRARKEAVTEPATA